VFGQGERETRGRERLQRTDEPIDGTIEIIGPDDEIALSDAFDVASHDEEDDGNSNASAAYEQVWGTIGDYDVSVELADGFDIAGKTRADETVTITDTDSELLAVVLGSDDHEDEISFAVGNAGVTSIGSCGRSPRDPSVASPRIPQECTKMRLRDAETVAQ